MEENGGAPSPSGDDVFELLSVSSPLDRARILIHLTEHSDRLHLGARDGREAMLDAVDVSQLGPAGPDSAEISLFVEADLAGASLRGAILRGANFRRANLRGSNLGQSHLEGANFDCADLREADLVGAFLSNASLGEANLGGALCEEAQVDGAILRYASMHGVVFEEACLQEADFWGADLTNSTFTHANCQNASFKEATLRGANFTSANLQGADFTGADLSQANLTGADLRNARFHKSHLNDAKLNEAFLQGVNLTKASISGIHLGGAWLERTRLNQRQLGGTIGDERIRDFEQARIGYLALERNFQELGDPDAVSWAYKKRRRMQKQQALQQGNVYWSSRQWRRALGSYAHYLGDQAVEWLCDYGESVPRVLGTMLLVYTLFSMAYGITGSVVLVKQTPHGLVRYPTRQPIDLAIFSLLAMTTSGSPAVGLLPSNELVHLLTGIQALVGIGLTGLAGFVAGNRIRR